MIDTPISSIGNKSIDLTPDFKVENYKPSTLTKMHSKPKLPLYKSPIRA